MKKLLSVILSASIVAGIMSFNVMASGETKNKVSADYATTETVVLQTGDTDVIAGENADALEKEGFIVNNMFRNGTNDDYVNKIFFTNDESRGSVIEIKQDGYEGGSDYKHNMPFLGVKISQVDTTKPFTAEAWVKNDGQTEQKIIIEQYFTENSQPQKKEFVVVAEQSSMPCWVKLSISYEPSTNTFYKYINDEYKGTETQTGASFKTEDVVFIKFLNLMESGSTETPKTTSAYWNDIRVYNTPSYYVNVDFRPQTTLSYGYGMDGAPYIGNTSLKVGTEEGYMAVENLTEGANWLATTDTKTKVSKSNDFVAELAIKPSANGNAVLCMRVVNPTNEQNKKEYRLFGIDKTDIKCGVDYEQVMKKDASSDEWYHLAAVVRKCANKIDVYLDGVYQKTIDTSATNDWELERINLWCKEDAATAGTTASNNEIGIGYLKIYEGSEVWQNIKSFGIEESENTVKATAEIDSVSGVAHNTLILAGYNADGLNKAQIENTSNTALTRKAGGITYRAFLWNSLDDLVPKCESVTLTND